MIENLNINRKRSKTKSLKAQKNKQIFEVFASFFLHIFERFSIINPYGDATFKVKNKTRKEVFRWTEKEKKLLRET